MENSLDVIELFLAAYAEDGIDIPVEPGLSLAVGLQVDVPVAVAATAA